LLRAERDLTKGGSLSPFLSLQCQLLADHEIDRLPGRLNINLSTA